ncbi:MAG: hydrogenase nickel incorporation protein HypB [Lachnospiraceae bacterium]|nr:hydrogenase nickel incorporation protein HypB [Lachnospiraceae bacterium]
MTDRFEILETKCNALSDNDRIASEVRALTAEKKVYFVNLMASPGAGKTTFLERTIEALNGDFRIGVLEADADGDVDAHRIVGAGAFALQVHTGGSCHMDAEMTKKGLEHCPLEDLDLVFLENVGNLVCPAEFDTGADLKVTLLSVPEGDDKPLKYPLMFTVTDYIAVTKTDVRPAFDFDDTAFVRNVRALNEKAPVVFLSSVTGEGFDAWIAFLRGKVREKR